MQIAKKARSSPADIFLKCLYYKALFNSLMSLFCHRPLLSFPLLLRHATFFILHFFSCCCSAARIKAHPPGRMHQKMIWTQPEILSGRHWTEDGPMPGNSCCRIRSIFRCLKLRRQIIRRICLPKTKGVTVNPILPFTIPE